jgi:hypothetical protein
MGGLNLPFQGVATVPATADESASGFSVTNALGGVALTGISAPFPVDPTKPSVGVLGISSQISTIPGLLPVSYGVHGKSTEGDGVRGETQVGSGVHGESQSGDGVHGGSQGGNGVSGTSTSGVGVIGSSDANIGVRGDTTKGTGVQGFTHAPDQVAVFGMNDAPGTVVPDGLNRPAGSGVWGHSKVEKGSGVVGSIDGNLTQAAGVVGIGPTAGRFFGDVEVTGTLSVDHDVRVTGDVFLTGGKDVAEQFEVDPALQFTPGTLMVIGEQGSLVPCATAYDKRAVGVVSGGGALKPAMTLGPSPSTGATAAIALVGTAFCRATADETPIEPGDLLTSSDVSGHAMKASDPARSFGAVIGKALAPLRKGRELIPIIIALQ